MCCCFVGKFSFRSLNTFFSSHCCHCCAASILKKKSFFSQSTLLAAEAHSLQELQGGCDSWLEWTFVWYAPKLDKADGWLEVGLPFRGTLVHYRAGLPETSKSSAMRGAVSSTWHKKTLQYQCGQETSYPSSISTESCLRGLREIISIESAVSCTYWVALGRVSAGQGKGVFLSTQHLWDLV